VTHDEIEELLGVYALDALEGDERQLVDDHLASCPRCRAELASHREVAALLGNAVESPAVAPAGLWDRISASLQDEPPALSPLPQRPDSRRFTAVVIPLGAVAAALILVVGLLAAKVINLDQQVHNLSQQATVSSVIANPAHKTVELTSATHPAWQATIVISNGQGYLINPSMPTLTRSQTFQLWALSRGKIVSLGVLGRNPSAAAVRLETDMTVLMITAEPLGGSPVPTTPVLVRGNLPRGI
jgi:anti-sigma-K factor RskA